VRYLLDTHVWLWMVLEPERLNNEARAAIATTDNVALVSVASAWEAAIKHSIGKLSLRDTVENLVRSTVRDFDVTVLAIELTHVVTAAALPFHHKDPFDRLLIAQSQVEGATLVTADESIRLYDGAILWAV
jgi:PIN domain nuclease of toxin-antitoxin system